MKNFMKAYRGQKGFTLIELLVVIIILGVLAAVVTLAVTRFIGRGVLESANAELVTVQTAIESCFADANSSEFVDAHYEWDGQLATSPGCDSDGDGVADTFAYDQMRSHKFKATYHVNQDGEVVFGDAGAGTGSATTPWGATKVVWSVADGTEGGNWVEP